MVLMATAVSVIWEIYVTSEAKSLGTERKFNAWLSSFEGEVLLHVNLCVYNDGPDPCPGYGLH